MPVTPLTSIPVTPELLIGVAELEPTDRGLQPHRLPSFARRQNSDPQMAMVEAQPAGARLVLRTAATRIDLVVLRSRPMYGGTVGRPDGIYDLVIDGELSGHATSSGGDRLILDPATGFSHSEPGPEATISFTGLPARDKTVEIWFPHNELTRIVDLRVDAPVQPVPRDRPRWVHHGSSVSHGSNASNPTGTWPVVAARLAGMDLHNLGFGGGALLDPFVARTIAGLPADLISVKLGINLVNSDLFRRRALGPAVHGFLDIIREAHPETPLLVVSSVYCPIQESTPGPVDPELSDGQLSFVATGDPAEVRAGKLTLEVIREELAALVEQRAQEDAHLRYLDGLELWGPEDVARHPYPDNLHPSPEAHRLMGERFAGYLAD
ncbi:GDSL-type esterase/lipase family protein [Corynebacterium doosanense]|uniref:Lipase n=1 Tax=Corynebacterium doosanense CAU 212 = DSM 45436 TaxID=558173 RepID=A0A097IIZ6_9CORY|nr:GDSL-type esterase/lipase family protein [Corynebacterium doosanense]AIT62083.1 lipase [Corynebacterium doosanense CAU 212 = DSM 45436]